MQQLSDDHGYGSWHLIENLAVAFALHKPSGWHPWVLVQPLTEESPHVMAIPRSTSSADGVSHPCHPATHRCRIDAPGRLAVCRKKFVPRKTILATPVHCLEPDPAALRAMLKTRHR